MDDYNENDSNWLLYLLIVLLGIIIVANIGVKIWKESLEREYGAKYEEAKTLSNEDREKYYIMEEAVDFYCIKLEDIKSNAIKIVKKNYIAIVAEMIFSVITLIPMVLMFMVFKLNKEIACFHPNKTVSIILFIEVVISMLICFMDISGSIETIEQYKQIGGLVNEMFEGLDAILDTINYQIN